MKRILLLVLLATPAFAHDFWIEPSTFRPAAGATFSASLRVGENFAGDPVPRNTPGIEAFFVRNAHGEKPVQGFERQDPAGFVTVDEAGTAILGYRSKGNPHEMPRDKFLAYAEEEGMRGLQVGEGIQRERFFRFAKSIVLVEPRPSGRGKHGGLKPAAPLGFRFELTPLDDSRFQLMLDHEPLRDAFVGVFSRDGKTLSARTDANGVVQFELGKGIWMIHATHILPSSDPAFQWDSLWASLTFER